MAVLHSYETQGNKESFADWISNITPTDTYLVSYSKKFPGNQPVFKWQIDRLTDIKPLPATSAAFPDMKEGDDRLPLTLISTEEMVNYMQIFSKTFQISDTALNTASWGRQTELKYQLEKAGKELKRWMETRFLSGQVGRKASGTVAGLTSGIFHLCEPAKVADSSTGAITYVEKANPTVADIYALTKQLFIAGSDADCIVMNQQMAPLAQKLIEHNKAVAVSGGSSGEVTEATFVADLKHFCKSDKDPGCYEQELTFTDPLGQTYCICFSRFCPENAVLILNVDNVSQVVLREPKASKLAKNGSSETWCLECEAGIRITNPWAFGVIVAPAAP